MKMLFCLVGSSLLLALRGGEDVLLPLGEVITDTGSLEEDTISPLEVESPEHIWQKGAVECSLLFIKVPKCASSTNGGIARRIAARIGLRGARDEIANRLNISACAVYANHRHANTFQKILEGNRRNVMLYTFLRHPASRALSQYYHVRVSRKGASTADRDVVDYLNRTNGAFLSNYIRPPNVNAADVASILDYYDFIGLAEREQESLVVMKMLWDLSFGDILYLSSKDSGSRAYDDKGNIFVPANKTDKVVRFMKVQLTKLMALDLRLIAAVNRSLDATIASFGPAFKQELALYESLLAESKVACADKAIFPYSDTGKKQLQKSRASCYWNDNGCGFPCLDQYWQANANKSNTAA